MSEKQPAELDLSEEAGTDAVEPIRIAVRRLEAKLQQADASIADLNTKVSGLFLMSIAEPTYDVLRRLASGRFGPYQRHIHLKRSLRHLRHIGFISVAGDGRISDLEKLGSNELSERVKVTRAGADFIALRESMQQDDAG